MKDTGEKILLKNTSMLYLMTIAKYVFPLLLFPYLTRVLTPGYYGIITYMTSITSYLSILIDFGFNFSATRKIAQRKNDADFITKIYASVIQGKVMLALLGGVVVLVVMPFISILRENATLLTLYYLSTFLLAFLPDFVYRGMEQMQGITLRYVISKAITTALTLLIVKGPQDILWIPVLNAAGNLVALLFAWMNIKKVYRVMYKPVPLKQSLAEIKESTVFFISTFASTAFTAANTLFMGFVNMSEAQIAYWGVAFQLISVVMSLYEPITSSIYPRMVISKSINIVKKILCIIQPLIVCGLIFCYFAAPLLIRIVAGAGYEDAIPIFRYMLPVLFFSFPAQILGFPVLGALKKENLATRATVVAAFFHIAGLFLLVATGKFSLLAIALLRSCTELLFMLVRICYTWGNRALLQSRSKGESL